MTNGNKRLHIICGMCGSNEDLEFEINQTGNCDNDGNEFPAVFIICRNCSSLTDLAEVIKENKKRIMKDEFYYCEFCGCHTNAKMRACCEKGREADKNREMKERELKKNV